MGAQAVRLSNVDIDNALKNKDFEVLFQPIFDLGNGALARVESFVRWRHTKLGLLPPGAFISFFESQGRMSELTRYVMANSLKAYTDWRGPYAPGLSINLALSDLTDDSFITHFQKLLRDHDFPADLVTLECPMPQVDMPAETAAAHFARLAGTGARLAIEVRGRANDLLRSLDPFPFDEIKTGGSAILRFARTVRGPGLSAIADLLDIASKANAAITAVGVEDQASLAALRGLGFTAAQGNHLGKVGELKEFRPHRINEVRSLLGLEALSQENLTALFRTEAPSPAASEESAALAGEEDALIGRLNERVAQFDTAVSEAAAPSPAAQDDEAAAMADKKAKAREKAKALMLAKRAKARAERKAAAIDRAKSKAAQKGGDAPLFEDVTDVPAAAVTPPPVAAREMQERLSREFPQKDVTPAAQKPIAPVAQKPEDAAPPAQPPQLDRAPKPEPAAQEDKKEPAPEVAPPLKKAVGDPFIIEPDDIAPRAKKTAAANQPPQRQAPTAPAKPAAQELLAPFTVSCGPANAYFQPGIRVGAAALPGAPDKPVAPAAPQLPKAPQMPAAVEKSVPERVAESFITAPAPAQSEEPIAARPRRPRRKKPFLKRTVIAYPKHFWPKSWRRAWKRRAAAKAALRANAEMGSLAAE
ncbi:MAG: EAL domain-containing protein [Parvularculaceae bacterium]